MCDGVQGNGSEANHQGMVPSGLGEASESVPFHLCQVWASLPCHAWQQSRRRYFCANTNCTSLTPAFLDAHILILEAAVVELHSIVAALTSDSSACPDSNFAPDDAGLQLAPASTDDNPGIVPEDFRAQKPVLTVIISDPSASISETASSTPTGSPPKKKFRDTCSSKKQHAKHACEAAAAALLSECASPADLTHMQQVNLHLTNLRLSLLNKWATPAPVPSGTVTGPSASDPVTLPTTAPDSLPDCEAKHRH